MFMDRTMLAMHFHEVHPDDVEVPKCHLCLQVRYIGGYVSAGEGYCSGERIVSTTTVLNYVCETSVKRCSAFGVEEVTVDC